MAFLCLRFGKKFQSTLPVGGATCGLLWLHSCISISIHAPRGGSDLRTKCQQLRTGDFNPRSPWGERPAAGGDMTGPINIFQSTLPVGGATRCIRLRRGRPTISIHAPRGGSDEIPLAASIWYRSISIHAPRGGSDLTSLSLTAEVSLISIHAPRGGSDLSSVTSAV